MSEKRTMVNLPGGIIVVGATDEDARILRARAAFVEQYCAARGWNAQNPELDQLFEIRKQEGWKNPT